MSWICILMIFCFEFKAVAESRISGLSSLNTKQMKLGRTPLLNSLGPGIESFHRPNLNRLIENSSDERPSSPTFNRSLESFRLMEGPGSSGGGDILKCGGSHFSFFNGDVPKYFLADTYSLFKSGILSKKMDLPEEIWLQALIHGLNEATPGLGDLVQNRLEKLRFVPNKGQLEELDDDHIDLSGTNCRKFQLAIQDLETGLVRFDQDRIGNLSFQELAYFKVHESLISLKKTGDDTTPIREELSRALNSTQLSVILKKESAKFIEVPHSAKIFLALKSLESIADSQFRTNCSFPKSITKYRDCLKFIAEEKNLLTEVFSFHSSNANVAELLEMEISMKIVAKLATAGFNDPQGWNHFVDRVRSAPAPLKFVNQLASLLRQQVSFVNIQDIDPNKYREVQSFILELFSNDPKGNQAEIQLVEKDWQRFELKMRNSENSDIRL